MASTISSLIGAAERGETRAAQALFDSLYSELRQLAGRELARNSATVSISPTTLLHEAYLDMASQGGPSFPDRARFLTYAARVMRGLIIDHMRSRRAHKRGGQFEITSLENQEAEPVMDDKALTRMSEALDELAVTDPQLAQVVDLKFFCGFSFSEIATIQTVSERTVQRRWDKARIYLHRSVSADVSL